MGELVSEDSLLTGIYQGISGRDVDGEAPDVSIMGRNRLERGLVLKLRQGILHA